jgi:hypothetical protein
MHDPEGITSMFQPLFDTVHFSKVGGHEMQLAPCVVELHCPLQGTSATSKIRSALLDLYVLVTTQLRLYHSTHLLHVQELTKDHPTASATGKRSVPRRKQAVN